MPQPPLDPDGLVGGAFRVEGLEGGDVPLVGQAGGAEVSGEAAPGGCDIDVGNQGLVSQPFKQPHPPTGGFKGESVGIDRPDRPRVGPAQ